MHQLSQVLGLQLLEVWEDLEAGLLDRGLDLSLLIGGPWDFGVVNDVDLLEELILLVLHIFLSDDSHASI